MRIEQLTFTRFVAAISIVIYHYGLGSYLFNNEYFSFIFKQANVGVSYFYTLSGFVMIIAYSGKKTKFYTYIKNRLARIYPVYILALFLVLASHSFKNVNIYDLTLNIFMVQSWVPGKALTINIPGWSLSVELFFYITFPFLLSYFYSKKSFKNIAIWVVGFWIISQLVFHLITWNKIAIFNYNFSDMKYHPLMHFNQFLIGNLAGLYFLRKKKIKQKKYYFHIISILLLLLLVLKFPIGLNFHNGLLVIIFIPLILLISLSKNILIKIITKKPFVFLGEISFGIYILQRPIWNFFSDYRLEKYLNLDKELDFTKSFLLRLILLIILSSISYLFFEKPLRNIIKNYSKKPFIERREKIN